VIITVTIYSIALAEPIHTSRHNPNSNLPSIHKPQLHPHTSKMFSPRAIATPLARAAFRPQTVRVTARAAFIRTQVAANSTISEAITKDHRELESYYNEIIENADDIDHQTRYGNQFTWELARHSVAEELLVYPAMEKYMGEKGKEHAESDRKQHHEVCFLSPVPLLTVLTNSRSRSSSKNSKT
jgi:hypothetical protein